MSVTRTTASSSTDMKMSRSSMKRRVAPLSVVRVGLRILMAQGDPSLRSWPRHTVPMEPRPSTSSRT